MKLLILFFYLLAEAVANNIFYDCTDPYNGYKCQRNCPEKQKVIKKTYCPLNMVCCSIKPKHTIEDNRIAPFYRFPNSVKNYEIEYDDSLIYYINKRLSKPLDVIGISPNNDTQDIESSNISEENRIILQNNINERASVKFCKNYTELAYDHFHAKPLMAQLLPFTIPIDNCVPLINPLIVGGIGVIKGEFPHMVALGYTGSNNILEYLCGGSLISEKFILTAAHCTRTRLGSPFVAMLGSTELHSHDSLLVEVADAFPHPDYKPSQFYNDIGLVELKNKVKFTKFIRPACLARSETDAQKYNKIFSATGWGKTARDSKQSNKLLMVPLKPVKRISCEKEYMTDTRFKSLLYDGINKNLLCAVGYLTPDGDTCQGDSGGPLQAYIPGHKCVFEIIGITAFGKACGSSSPGVYTYVYAYLSWIENIVWS